MYHNEKALGSIGAVKEEESLIDGQTFFAEIQWPKKVESLREREAQASGQTSARGHVGIYQIQSGVIGLRTWQSPISSNCDVTQISPRHQNNFCAIANV